MKLRSISIYGLFVSKKVITITTFLISLVVANLDKRNRARCTDERGLGYLVANATFLALKCIY